MKVTTIIANHLRYNYWANEGIVTWLRTLDRNLLMKQTPSSFPSIDLTLQHIIHSQNFWMAVLTNADLDNMDTVERVDKVEDVMDWLMTSSQKMIDTYGNYNEAELLEVIDVPDNRGSRFDFILHSVNHGAYHRGQVVTMARCLGITQGIPSTDIDVFVWGGSRYV
ncbi:MAG TPA: DinB family protein [Cyclobacteriaceae bacterium]|nr:DinB family protein [Cyclobacteriaceae bacterium]